MSRKENNKKSDDISQKRKGLKRFLRWPNIQIDLSQARHRRNTFFGLFGFLLFCLLFITGNYQIYHYTESSEFCGTACHTMAPESTRFESSAHANVECVECHIGPGPEFYVRAKIDGMKQVVAMITNTYDKPIRSPVHNLRPARETCENCHSPTTYQDNIVKTIIHYDNDEQNTLIQSTLILKMGGWEESTGISQGIHWHVTNEVYYIPGDDQRQIMMWIGVKDDDGTMREYYARDVLTMGGTSFVEDARENGEIRLMDCIDCHNRAAHYIQPPAESLDMAIEDGLISQDLPYIRAFGLDVLTADYANQEEAYQAIDALSMNYQNIPSSDLPEGFEHSLDIAIGELKQIYDDTFFHEMLTDWQTNPSNDRHVYFPGCFRCHDGNHVQVNETGTVIDEISIKCNLCHTVPIVGRGNEMLFEAPVIVGAVPETHDDFSWTVEHRDITYSEEQECYECHGQGFCNNGACHNLNHPEDMLFSHAEEFREQGSATCQTCHQNITCTQCHPGGIVGNP